MKPVTKEVKELLMEALRDVRVWAIVLILIAIWIFVMQFPV